MRPSIRYPVVNFRLAVRDLCELTGLAEREILGDLYESLNRFYIEHPERKNSPIWFMSSQCRYKLPHTSALSYIYGIKDGSFQWDVAVDTQDYGPLPEPIVFEQFYLYLQDLLTLLSRILDNKALEDLRSKWKYSAILEREPSTGREAQKVATKNFKETLQYDANVLAAQWDKAGKKYTKQTIANALAQREEYRGRNPATLERNFRLPRNLSQ